jgi:hypothetical protein
MFKKSKIAVSGMLFGALLAMAGTPAYATMVTYSTTGSFNGGGSSVTFNNGVGNTLTLTFNGMNPATTVNTGTTFTFSSMGHIITSTTGAGAAIANGTTLSINIAQLVPPGSGSLGGTLVGTLSQTSSTGTITFNINSVVIAGISYSIANNPLALVPPSTNGGDTSIQAQISGGAVPEPMTSALIGLGLVGLASLRKFRPAAR